MWFVFTVLLYQFCNIIQHSNAFPTGAGSCNAGANAVGGAHLNATEVLRGSLDDIFLNVIVAGNVYPANSRIPLLAGLDYQINLLSIDDDAFFLGTLIRLEALEGQDLTGVLEPANNLGVAMACEGLLPSVTGVTHVDSTQKRRADASIRFNQVGSIAMDITIVIANVPILSIYAFDTFTIEVSDVTETSAAPTAFATFAPTPLPPSSTVIPTSITQVPTSATVVPSMTQQPTTSYTPTTTLNPSISTLLPTKYVPVGVVTTASPTFVPTHRVIATPHPSRTRPMTDEPTKTPMAAPSARRSDPAPSERIPIVKNNNNNFRRIKEIRQKQKQQQKQKQKHQQQ